MKLGRFITEPPAPMLAELRQHDPNVWAQQLADATRLIDHARARSRITELEWEILNDAIMKAYRGAER